MTVVAGRLADVLPGADGFVELGIVVGVGIAILVLRVRRGRAWRWLSYAFGVAAVWGSLLLFLFGGTVVEDWVNQRDFDPASWRAAELGTSDTRVWMVDELLERPLTGMKLSDIDALLGPDDSPRGTGYGAGYWDDWDRVWWLGAERGFIRIDSEWLVLRAGADGIVTEARLVRD